MLCPKCNANMEKVSAQHLVVDRCSECKGLWLDMLEHEDLKSSAAQIDTGDAKLGAKYNAIERINCPSCANSRMIRQVDPQQPHIWFESCPVCYGRFYDAGEFRDFAESSWKDFFRQFKVRARE